MRRLIESLMPDDRQTYWRWIVGVFAFYVMLMIVAAGVFTRHESSTTVGGKQRSVTAASMPIGQVATHH